MGHLILSGIFVESDLPGGDLNDHNFPGRIHCALAIYRLCRDSLVDESFGSKQAIGIIEISLKSLRITAVRHFYDDDRQTAETYQKKKYFSHKASLCRSRQYKI